MNGSTRWVSKKVGISTLYSLVSSSSSGHASISWDQAIGLGSSSVAFRKSLTRVLSQSPHKAFFFECNPIRADRLKNIPFQFVVTPARQLDGITVDVEPFFAQIEEGRKRKLLTSSFANLGKDAVLVVPTALHKSISASPPQEYAHLASFVRGVSVEEVDFFWKAVFESFEIEIKNRFRSCPRQWTWLSTHGGGVSWLHMRIDSRPKYYHHKKFKHPPQ